MRAPSCCVAIQLIELNHLQVENGGGGELEIKVFDWDRLSAADEVGRLIITAGPAVSARYA